MTTFRQEKTGPNVGAVEPVETKKLSAGESLGISDSTEGDGQNPADSTVTMSNMLQAALDLAKANWSVFPCIESGAKAKAPYVTGGFKAATTDPEQITQWWTQWPNALVAIALPAHMLAFDIDIRHGGSLEALEATTGPLPRTLTSWSGRNDGGCHLYFFKPEREISQRQLPKGVDLRTGGKHYLIAPPSLHPATGEPYTWQHAPIAELPVSAIDALAPPKPRVTLPAPVSEHSGNLNGLVRSVSEAVEGERNQKLYWASCRAFDHGNDDIIQDLFEAALSVGLTESEASATIDSARRTERQPEPFVPNGNFSPPAQNFTPASNDAPEPEAVAALTQQTEPNPHDPLAGAFTATWLMDQEFPPVEYAVPGVLTEGLSVIVSPPKVGKSWWVLDAAIACSTGGLAMNAIQVDQRPVLYLALEDGQRRLQKRLRDLGVAEVSEDLTFLTEIPAGAFLTIGAFLEQNAARKPLIILDTLGKARDVYTGNDAYQKDYKELGAFKSLVDHHPGSSLLIVHHTNKALHGDFVASVSGTQGIAGAADSILTVERERGKAEAVLNVTSRDAAEGSYAMTFNNGAWHLDGADLAEAAKAVGTRKATTGVGDPMAQLIEEVAKHPEGIKAADLATQLHWDEAKVRTYLARAHEANRIARIKRGLYAPVASVASVISDADQHHDATQITDVTQLFPGDSQ